MVNPGAFRGSRKEFLMSEKASYSAGVVSGYASEALALIQRRYFKRYPIDLPHDEEPSAESLAKADDEAPDPDTVEPDPRRLTAEEFKAAMDLVEERRQLLAYRKAQIKRWMAYQHMKDNDLNPKESGAYNPYNALMVKLTGKEIARPRMKTAANIWRKTKRNEIEAELKLRFGETGAQKERHVTERDKIAREMFSKLSDEEQRHWKGVATDEHNEAMKEYKKELELANSPSVEPADRQRCIQGLVRFVQPILDRICDVTGWKATLMVGGPEPAHDGKLNIISIHSGTTTGDVKLTFGSAERERYKKYVVPIFGSFLQKCYSPEECRSWALNPSEGFTPMSTLDLDEKHAFIHSFETPPPNMDFRDPLSMSPASTLVDGTPHHLPSKTTPVPHDAGAVLPAPSSVDVQQTRSMPTRPEISQNTHIHSPPVPSNPPPVAVVKTALPIVITAPESLTQSDPSSVGDDTSPFPFDLQTTTSPAPTTARVEHIPSGAPSAHPRSPTHDHQPSLARFPVRSPARSPAPSLAPSPVPSPARSPAPSLAPSPALPAPFPAPSPSRSPGDVRRSTRRIADPTETGIDKTTSTVSSTRKSTKRKSSAAYDPAARSGNEGQEAKRRKTDRNADLPQPSTSTSTPTPTASSTPAAIQVPNNGPDWFKNAYSMLQSAALGPEWEELIRKWTAFEAKEHYKEAGKLGNLHRPTSVGDWIKRGRSSTWRPEISSPAKYGKEYMRWWTSLQPAWRLSAQGKIIVEATDGDWGALRKPGTNGLLSVVCSLFHWGTALQKNGKEVKQLQWIEAVRDCTTVCDYLLR